MFCQNTAAGSVFPPQPRKARRCRNLGSLAQNRTFTTSSTLWRCHPSATSSLAPHHCSRLHLDRRNRLLIKDGQSALRRNGGGSRAPKPHLLRDGNDVIPWPWLPILCQGLLPVAVCVRMLGARVYSARLVSRSHAKHSFLSCTTPRSCRETGSGCGTSESNLVLNRLDEADAHIAMPTSTAAQETSRAPKWVGAKLYHLVPDFTGASERRRRAEQRRGHRPRKLRRLRLRS